MLTKRFCTKILVLNKNRQCVNIKSYTSLTSVTDKSAKYEPIANFYAGKSVFITGGNGFVGKAIIEKLLRSCTELDKIYMLIRDKRGVNINRRIETMLENPVFSTLKSINPNAIKKIVPIAGDVTQPCLGISPEDEQILIDNVSVVVHSAASVKFNEPLSVAMNINFEGTQQILALCQRIKNIKGFVYISTAYAHTENNTLTETVYPYPAKIEDVYKFMAEYGHDEKATKKFIGGQPYTYTFTKALAEAYVAENHGEVPTVILRPSIVTASKNEPIKGWIDNWYGGTGTMHNSARGWNRVVLCNPSSVMDMIPVDYVANMTIVAAARAHNSKELKVYNCTTSAENNVAWGQAFEHFKRLTVKYNKHEIPYPTIYYTESKTMLNVITMLFQVLPAHLADLWLRLRRKEAKFVPIMNYVVTARYYLQFFTSHNWEMKAGEARSLYQSLSPSDRSEFPCDPAEIDWPQYMTDYWRGTWKYLFNKYKL